MNAFACRRDQSSADALAANGMQTLQRGASHVQAHAAQPEQPQLPADPVFAPGAAVQQQYAPPEHSVSGQWGRGNGGGSKSTVSAALARCPCR